VTSIGDIDALSRSAARKAAGDTPPPSPHAQAVTQDTMTAAPQAIHVRLDSAAANRDEGIYPLRNYILANPGPRPVFIHITDKIIRTNTGISLEAQFENCAGVVETWKE